SDRYAMFKNSAPVNHEVTSLATEFINTLGLGKHDGVDMLNLTYTLQPFEFAKNTDNRLELIDSYIRLDRNLEQLFNTVDRATGGNSVIFLVATPPSSTVRRDEEKWNIPYGEFSTRKAGSLLNMYLMAVYGTGEWVKGYFNGHFYLNNQLIKDKNLDPKAVRADAASFVARMSGVKDVFTIDQIFSGDAGENAAALKRNTHIPTAGDIFVNVIPGWEIVNDFSFDKSVSKKNRVERITSTTAPAFILAPDVKPQRLDKPIDVRVIAPTVARLLRIRSPNAAALPALELN
ncbi:MAG: alkaline phosphatase family protein, partial [Muribaculaceae bacterium]|nr:alkaline phosphatase family protein [Muribaculaceae bacterium]